MAKIYCVIISCHCWKTQIYL